ncbi:GH15 family glucan-1,4-alpha-glucosidase [Methylocaldum szegediense]|uniref:GH15 family glucan-1,4-alpha-glucosidase n=2 Tax=Methylocaldum szegediense TaxID=73780 RepID=A0ABM9I3C2_9GAMM|nr:GH15 family glucan-1,4-alpha-glucosidase [Methylocaldum szegediense]
MPQALLRLDMHRFKLIELLWGLTCLLGFGPGWAASSPAVVLDDFETLSGWMTVAAEGAHAELTQDTGRTGMGMRLDFDFRGGTGYVTVRKKFSIPLPENYAFTFYTRAEAPANKVEFKIIDPSGDNVWWRRRFDVKLPEDWQQHRIKKRMFDYAWGPSNAPLKQVGFVEFSITASTGGKGSIWIDDFRLERREPIIAYNLTPKVTASTSAEGHGPQAVLDGNAETSWRSGALAESQWLQIDFLKRREYGGLVIEWDRDDYATAYEVQISENGKAWQPVYSVGQGNGRRDYIYMPDAESRYLRLELKKSSRGRGYGISSLTVKPFDFSASPNAFFETIAREAPRGTYPKYFYGEQSYFTVVGVDGSDKEGLLNEEGALEVDKNAFSIEPFLYRKGKLVTWNDVNPVHELERGYLPVPSVTWCSESIEMKVTAFAATEPGQALYARYRVENNGRKREQFKLLLAIRPFQVNPPWQSLNMVGGVAPIHEIVLDGGIVRIDGNRSVVPLTTPDHFGATSFDEGSITDFLMEGKVPQRTEARDPLGYASAALEYELDLPPGASREIFLAIPYENAERFPEAANVMDGNGSAFGRARFREAVDFWEAKLVRADLIVPPKARKLRDTVRSNLAYIFINRDGAALYPGSRSYARSWIRDAVLMSAALLGMGYTEEVRRFIEWYAGFQFPSGKIPCCVDHRGADSVPENDSHGEFIYAVAEYYRYTRDIGFVYAMWPTIVKSVRYIEQLSNQRKGEEYKTPEKSMFFGMMPESISHEGYSARPVHSYWDGFWTLRGLKDAVDLAALVMDEASAAHFHDLRDDFRGDLYRSIERTMAKHKIAFLPGSAELGDFDATATAMAVAVGGEESNLPAAALNKTFDDYYDYFERRRDNKVEWTAYTPYEVRTVEALVRMGRREQALELLDFLLKDQRPSGWNQWAEVVWRDPKHPKFIGDMPHAWIGAEFVRAMRALYAYERESDQALVLAAGIPQAWLEGGRDVGVKRLPTWYGTLSYVLRREEPDTLRLWLSGDLALPPGKIVLKAPADRPIRSVTVNRKPVDTFNADQVIIGEFPAEVTVNYDPAVRLHAN